MTLKNYAIEIPGIDTYGINSLYNVKDFKQYEHAVQLLLEDKCPFCPPIDEDIKQGFI